MIFRGRDSKIKDRRVLKQWLAGEVLFQTLHRKANNVQSDGDSDNLSS